MQEVAPVPCPCGSSTRIITAKDTAAASFHVTHIRDSTRHYHKKTTEIYHILEGEGVLEIGGDSVPLTPGQTVLIEAGTPHRGYGDFKTIVVAVPAFDAGDEFFPDDNH
ncbi:MAG: cupin domain-containing protein [Candidatus Omnitrophota bacterium]|nr:MAG: cupin domain-containing protein [Candidatus Omnitrophota bacterium]